MSFLLTDAERERFLRYCRHEAETNSGLVKQLEGAGVMAEMVKRQKLLAGAYAVVAADMASIEAQTLGEQKP